MFLTIAVLCLVSRDTIKSGSPKKGRPSLMEREEIPRTRFLAMQADYQFSKLRDPKSGQIPTGMRNRELSFVSKIPEYPAGMGQSWNWRGPANIGGRMLCIAIDMDNENHLLAGSASGGMWESADRGQTWHKTTAPDAEQSAACLVQDKRPGKHNIWYYGTGELLSTTARTISTNARTIGIGNGIFKSADNGTSWQPLPATQVTSQAHLLDLFQGIWRIVTDPVRQDKDIVYAACYGAIMRSENGGASWEVTLGDIENKSFASDLAITADGVLYAALSNFCLSVQPPEKAGIWRSVDGLNWKNITPAGFPHDNRVTRLSLAPSNENIMYVFTESQSADLSPFNGFTNSVNTFWKMTWDTNAGTPLWENRTHGIPGGGDGSLNSFPYSFVVYGGYTFTMSVKPDNEEVVFLGGLNLLRSENGFSDSVKTTWLGGEPFDMDSMHQLHPDQHGITFLPSDPAIMFIANDGGIFVTNNCMADSSSMTWDRLNNKLVTSQFYSVAIDHGSSGNDWVLGGLQDNNWFYTVTDDQSENWLNINLSCDGFSTCVADNWEYCAISAYSGNIWTTRFDNAMHATDIFEQLPDTLMNYYDPDIGSNSLFPFYQNFALDPNNNETFYLPTVTSIWRKDNLKAAAYDSTLRNAGWSHLSNVDVGPASEISSIAVSKTPANRLYFGTNLGKVYRLDDAGTGNPLPINITGNNFPGFGFVAFIDVNPDNADHLMVTFSNYGVQSLFHSADGGSTWEAVGGNLEEFPDGSGDGPSIRCTKLLSYQGKKIILAGTSCGLFSTTKLSGDSTIWIKEGATTIGNVIVDMIDSRQSDGFMAIATHGNGVYSTWFNSASGIEELQVNPLLQAGNVFPNPVRDLAQVELIAKETMSIRAILYSSAMERIRTMVKTTIPPGKHYFPLQLNDLPVGMYYLVIEDGRKIIVRKIIKIASL